MVKVIKTEGFTLDFHPYNTTVQIGTAKSLLKLAGALAMGGDAVKDDQRLYK